MVKTKSELQSCSLESEASGLGLNKPTIMNMHVSVFYIIPKYSIITNMLYVMCADIETTAVLNIVVNAPAIM